MSASTNTPFTSPDTTLPVPNVPLLRKIREHIEAHPEEWDQGDWRSNTACGTAYCFAGRAAHLDGAEWLSADEPACLVPDSGDLPDDLYYTCGTGKYMPVPARARRILGLTQDEARSLFNAPTVLSVVDDQLTAIYARAGERP
jgi:hypothetical protein